MDTVDIINVIREELRKELPGRKAQFEMVPKTKLSLVERKPVNPRKGGVMLLLYKNKEELNIAFIQRTVDGGVHSGQISFPGGKFEETDKDLIETALRETEEEVGAKAAHINVLGQLTTTFIPASNFLVTPVVGFFQGNPKFDINPSEVAELIEIPLIEFLREKNKTIDMVDVRGEQWEVPLFKVGDYKIWGATAMMLNEFLQLIEKINGNIRPALEKN